MRQQYPGTDGLSSDEWKEEYDLLKKTYLIDGENTFYCYVKLYYDYHHYSYG